MVNQEDNDKLNAVLDSLRKKREGQSGTKKPESTEQAATLTEEQLAYAGIKKRYQKVTFPAIERRGLPDDNCIRENYQRVKSYADQLEDNAKSGYGLILSGDYGTMKTTMAVATLRNWLESGHSGMIVPMCSLIDNLYTMRVLNREEFAKYEHRIRCTSLLVLDDLGGEDTDQKWVLAKVDSIITERYNEMLPTIITTNLTAEEMAGTYSGRVLDRMKNTAQRLVFNTGSQRRNRWEE